MNPSHHSSEESSSAPGSISSDSSFSEDEIKNEKDVKTADPSSRRTPIEDDDTSNSSSESESENENHRFDNLPSDDSVTIDSDNESEGSSSSDDESEEICLAEKLEHQRQYGTGKITRRKNQLKDSIQTASERLAQYKMNKKKTMNSHKPNATSDASRPSKSSSSSTTTTKTDKTKKKKKSKHAPQEVSSKRNDFFKRGGGKIDMGSSGLATEDIMVTNKYKPRDPRMTSLSGHFDVDQFEQNYKFLEEIEEKEIKELKRRIGLRKKGPAACRDASITDTTNDALEDDKKNLSQILSRRSQRDKDRKRREWQRGFKGKFNISSDKLCANDTDFPECLPSSYGISCGAHDFFYNPMCRSDDIDNIPAFCFEQFCFVDFESCITSTELFQKSDIFDELDLYFSYTKCGSTSTLWDEQVTTSSIAGKDLIGVVPRDYHPFLFKRDSSGNVISDGKAYWDNDIPWEGVIKDYLDAITKDSMVNSIKYTHRSPGSSLVHPESSYTAAVKDVSSRISDFGAGDFWITADRLKMVPFSVPYYYGEISLWVSMSQYSSNSGHHLMRLTKPFTSGTWILLVLIVTLTSCVGLWLTSKHKSPFAKYHEIFRSDFYRNSNRLEKLKISFPAFQDFIMMNFTSWFSGGVEFHLDATYPFKLLMIGFSFLVMVSYSAYVANLAAFLTTEAQNVPISSMHDVISKGLTICAPPVLEHEFKSSWPETRFVFNYNHSSHIQGMIDYFDEGMCVGLISTKREIKANIGYYEKFCSRGLISTDIVVKNEILAFPATPEVAPGLSYLIASGLARGIDFEDFQKAYDYDICSLEVKVEGDEMKQLKPVDMLFPIIVFFLCFFFAIAWQIINNRRKRNMKAPKRQVKRSRTTLSDFTRSEMNPVTIPFQRSNKSLEGNTLSLCSDSDRKKIEGDNMLSGDQFEINMCKAIEVGKSNHLSGNDSHTEIVNNNSNSQYIENAMLENVDKVRELIQFALKMKEIVESVPEKKKV